jgi:hypothetical protein
MTSLRRGAPAAEPKQVVPMMNPSILEGCGRLVGREKRGNPRVGRVGRVAAKLPHTHAHTQVHMHMIILPFQPFHPSNSEDERS